MNPARGSDGAVTYAVILPGPLVSRDSGTQMCCVLSRSFRSITLTSAALTFCPHCCVPGSKAHVAPKVLRPKGHPRPLESTVLWGCFSAHCPVQGPASSAWPPGQECEPPARGTATQSPGDRSHGAGMAAGHVWPPGSVSVPAEQALCRVISPGCERLWRVTLQEHR